MFAHKRTNSAKLASLMVLLLIVLLAAPVLALEVISGSTVTVPDGKITGPLFVAGEKVLINADVDGDVFAAGQSITVNGQITGDLLAASQNLVVNGSVQGNARCAGEQMEINGSIGQSLTAAARIINFSPDSKVKLDALIFANRINSRGTIGRQWLGAAESINLSGPVGTDVHIWGVGLLKIDSPAVLGGNLFYRSTKAAEIDPAARIAGATHWEPMEQTAKTIPGSSRSGVNWPVKVAGFVAGVLFWGALGLLFPQFWQNLSRTLYQKTTSALGWGLLLLLLTPIAAVLFMITVVGIPLGLVLLILYGILLYAGKIMIGDAIGRLIAQRLGWNGWLYALLAFMLGYALLILVSSIPIIGLFISISIAILALGTVFIYYSQWRQYPSSAPIKPVID